MSTTYSFSYGKDNCTAKDTYSRQISDGSGWLLWDYASIFGYILQTASLKLKTSKLEHLLTYRKPSQETKVISCRLLHYYDMFILFG